MTVELIVSCERVKKLNFNTISIKFKHVFLLRKSNAMTTKTIHLLFSLAWPGVKWAVSCEVNWKWIIYIQTVCTIQCLCEKNYLRKFSFVLCSESFLIFDISTIIIYVDFQDKIVNTDVTAFVVGVFFFSALKWVSLENSWHYGF